MSWCEQWTPPCWTNGPHSTTRSAGAVGEEVAFTSGGGGFAANRHAFRAAIRQAAFRRVEWIAQESVPALASTGDWDEDEWDGVLDRYYAEHDWVGIGPDARGPEKFRIVTSPSPVDFDDAQLPEIDGAWIAWQQLEDPSGDGDWFVTLRIDVEQSTESLVTGPTRLLRR